MPRYQATHNISQNHSGSGLNILKCDIFHPSSTLILEFWILSKNIGYGGTISIINFLDGKFKMRRADFLCEESGSVVGYFGTIFGSHVTCEENFGANFF